MSNTVNHQTSPVGPRIQLITNDAKTSMILRVQGGYDPSITYDYITGLLSAERIIYGLDQAGIQRLLEQYQQSNRPDTISEGVVAKGKEPQEGQDGTIEFFVEEPPPVAIAEDGRADYRNIQRYIVVDAGQHLATLTPPVEGEPGLTIFGDEIAPQSVKYQTLEAGDNVLFDSSSGEYRARIHGIFRKGRNRIDVQAELMIQESVGLESGNIHYDGDVLIGGNIDRGSTVSALGRLRVGGTIEAGEIRAGGDLMVKGGINTRREGVIKVSGTLESGFIDNAKVVVEQNIKVTRSITNSTIITYGSCEVDSIGGAITGGEIYCFGSIAADMIGNRAEVPTKIILGEHFKNRQLYEHFSKDLEDVTKAYEDLVGEITKIKHFVQRMRGQVPVEKKAQFRLVFGRYQEMQKNREHLEQQIEDLKVRRYNKEEVRLTVRDTLFPGVEIHYRGYIEKVKAPTSSCIYKFNPRMERPVIEAFKR